MKKRDTGLSDQPAGRDFHNDGLFLYDQSVF